MSALPFRSGQEVTAVVQSVAGDGSVTLNVNGRLLQAVTSMHLLQGMSLKLAVKMQDQQLTLHLQPQEQQRLVLQQALRQLLPRQESLKPLLETLANLLPRNEAGSTQATGQKAPEATAAAAVTAGAAQQADSPMEPVQKLALQLLRQFATAQALGEAKGVQQAITHSGVFLEHMLTAVSSGGFQPDGDIKVLLLRLAALLRQRIGAASSPQQIKGAQDSQAMRQADLDTLLLLQKQTEAALARVQVNQLSSAGSTTPGEERPLFIELPVFNPQQQQTELLKLKIQREGGRGGKENGECWSVTLHMSPKEYGEIQAVVSLTGGKVGVTFWCAEEHTRELFREQLVLLTERLQEQGLEVGRLSAHQGRPANSVNGNSYESLGLIDIKA
jgi:flagellar hook-length control protein FliK